MQTAALVSVKSITWGNVQLLTREIHGVEIYFSPYLGGVRRCNLKINLWFKTQKRFVAVLFFPDITAKLLVNKELLNSV